MDMQCRTCNEIKPENCFGKRARTKDGKRGLCKQCKSNNDKEYRRRNKKKIAQKAHEAWQRPETKDRNRYYIDMRRFGLDATVFVKGKNCELCGISNDNSILKWGQRLQIHHRDNKGRHNEAQYQKPNNDPSNLQILCKSCHPRIDNPLKDYSGRGKKIWITRRRNEREKNKKTKT